MEQQLMDFVQNVLMQLNDLTALAWAVPLIVILVAILKRAPWLRNVQAGTIQFVLQVVIWTLYAVLSRMGQGEAFQSWVSGLAVILQTLLPLMASLFGVEWLYRKAVQKRLPVISHQRSVG